ncbi:MAG: stage III sporulation protein AB [Clostridiales bacterium]|jgi:stage III sporulation protein AB|nr:stage III sporulation protein AB [Clostridiales bacterium]
MTLQIAGGLLIIAATTLIGWDFSARGARRVRDLTELKKSLILLKSQIDYSIYTLPQAFSHISPRVAAPFDEFYAKLAKDVEGGADAASAWVSAVHSLKNSNLDKTDLENFAILGMSLGAMDSGVQINSIDMVITNIDDSLKRLLAENPKNSRMYRGLGIVAGLLITIVLI